MCLPLMFRRSCWNYHRYMAPEQFNGSHLDEKVDVYALGCILNECLTRRGPWRDAPNFFQVTSSSLWTAQYLQI